MKNFSTNLMRAGVVVLAAVMLVGPSRALAADDATVVAAAAAGVSYLAANQQADGSISGLGGETQWSAVAVAADGKSPDSFAPAGGASLTDALKADVPTATTPATTVERQVIAVSAAGGDPTSFGGVDYAATLAGYANGGQIGDPTLLNDDAFGVIAADAAVSADASVAPNLKPVAQDGLDYLLAHQQSDGGFSYTTTSCAWCGTDSNDTAAAIVAMDSASHLGLINVSLPIAQTSALSYLLGTQQSDGGFAYDAYSPSDGSSTAWGLMALNVVGEPVRTQATAARDWLLTNQNPDGGFSYGAYGLTTSDTYTTAHAVTALLGTSWLLRPVPLSATPVSGGQGSGATQQSSTTPVVVPVTVAVADPTPAPVVLASQTDVNSAPPVTTTVVLAATPAPAVAITTPTPTQTAIQSKSGVNYTLVTVLGLFAVALGWFVLQSTKKK